MPTMTKAGYTPPKPEKKAPAPPPPKKKRKKRRGPGVAAIVSMAIFAVAVLVGAGTLYVYTQTQPYAQTFVPGTLLMGYPLANATQEDAQNLIKTIEAEHVTPWRYEISCMGQTYVLTAQDVALSIDSEATLAPLWAAGHEGGMLARYVDMLRLRREPVAQQPVLAYDMDAVDALLETVRADVECAPVDATVAFTPGRAEPFSFTQEEVGYALDLTGVREAIEQSIRTLSPGSEALEAQVLEPDVYQTELENDLWLRSRVVMRLHGEEATVHNVTLAAQALNGLRLDAGQTLSFNEAVGARTEENGYQTAPEPAYGADAVGVGGGVCQASTALYRAALLGGVEVAERSAAARPVDYCDMGQEAAVSDQGLDLVLCNRTDAPLFISARVYEDGDNGATLELMLIGETLGARYALHSLIEETGTIEEPVYIRDREGRYATYTDERVPVGEALEGYAVQVERVTIDDAGLETASEIVSESTYDAVPPTIYVGVTEREDEQTKESEE